jgi:hypothetical protein
MFSCEKGTLDGSSDRWQIGFQFFVLFFFFSPKKLSRHHSLVPHGAGAGQAHREE